MALFGNYAANQTIDIGPAGQQPGTATNDNASVGNVGEVADNTGTIGLTTAVTGNVCLISSLGIGDWDVSGQVTLSYTTATQSGDATAGTATGAALVADQKDGWDNTRLTTTTCKKTITLTPKRFLFASGGNTINLLAQANFSAGTCSAIGYIHARRVR